VNRFLRRFLALHLELVEEAERELAPARARLGAAEAGTPRRRARLRQDARR
jgi:hypothetical protein